MLKITILAATAATLAVTASAGAATLVDFGFAGAGNINESAPYTGGDTSVDPDVEITSGLRIGSGLDPLTRPDSFSFFGFSDTNGGTTPEPFGIAESVSDNEFLTFSATADAGFTLDLSGGSVVLDSFFKQGNGTRTFDGLALFTSVTGFMAGDEVDTVTGIGFNAARITLDIPDTSAFESVAGPVEFRIVPFRTATLGNATTDGGGANLDASAGAGVTLNGEVAAIPEPAAVAGIGLVGLVALRRRR